MCLVLALYEIFATERQAQKKYLVWVHTVNFSRKKGPNHLHFISRHREPFIVRR